MKKLSVIFVVILFTLLLTGCSLFTSFAPTATPLPSPTPYVLTEIPLPTMEPTVMPTPTFTPEPTATPSVITAIEAVTTMDNYILRTGPGRLFPRIDLYPMGSAVKIIGRESSNNWVLVQTADNRSGWMNIVGLSFNTAIIPMENPAITENDLLQVPAYYVTDSQTLHGHVYKSDQTPASGIVVGFFPVGSDDINLQDNCITNSAGEWFIYTPKDTTGNWTIGPVGYNCTGNAVDNPVSCSLLGILPDSREITLPLENNLDLEFSITQ